MDNILTHGQASEVARKIKENHEKLILVGGCFDLLHLGHIEFLKSAKDLGGKLMVIIESDETIKRLKGQSRPVNSQYERAVILANLKMVDYVVTIPPFDSDQDYFSLVKDLKPDIIAVTKGDLGLDKKIKQALEVGAKVIEVIEQKENFSTSNLINKILK